MLWLVIHHHCINDLDSCPLVSGKRKSGNFLFFLRSWFCWRRDEVWCYWRCFGRLMMRFKSSNCFGNSMTSTRTGWLVWKMFYFVLLPFQFLLSMRVARRGWRRRRQRRNVRDDNIWWWSSRLFLVLDPPILKPNLDLLFTQVQSVSNFNSPKSWQVHVLSKFSFQVNNLSWRECSSKPGLPVLWWLWF